MTIDEAISTVIKEYPRSVTAKMIVDALLAEGFKVLKREPAGEAVRLARYVVTGMDEGLLTPQEVEGIWGVIWDKS